MQWSYPELRRRLIEAGLWPQGRMARLACYLAASAIVLFALQKILGTVRSLMGRTSGRLGWIPRFVAAVLFFILAFRWSAAKNPVASAQSADRHLRLYRRDSGRAAGRDGD